MALADTSRAILGYIPETTWGTTPSTPELQAVRFTGESLNPKKDVIVSNEVRSDRQITDQIDVGDGAEGGFDFEMSYGEYETLFEHAFFSAKTTSQTITGTDLSLSGANIISTANAFLSASNAVGQYIQISGSGTGSNNGRYRITSFSVGSLALEDDQGVTASFTSDSTNASLSYKSSEMIRNGTTLKSLTIEKGFEDISEYFQFTGMRVNTLSMSMAMRSILTGSFSFIGKNGGTTTTTIDNSGTYTASAANDVLNSSANLSTIQEGGSVSATRFFQSLDFTLSNGLREQPAAGQSAAGQSALAGVGASRCNVSGNAVAYFDDTSLWTKFKNGTASSLRMFFADAAGNDIIFSFPNIKYSRAGISAGGADTDVIQSFEWQALRDLTTDCTIQVDFIAA